MLVFGLSVMTLCGAGSLYAAARACEPVEAKGWEGAKEALQQIKVEPTLAAPPEPPAAPVPLTVCYRPVTVDTVQGPVGALALYLGAEGDSFMWPIDNAVGLSVTDAVYALGEDSVLTGLDPASIEACPPAVKVDLPAPPAPSPEPQP